MNATGIYEISSADIEKIGSVFADSLAEVISKISGLYFDILPSGDDAGFDGIIGLMRLDGEKKSGMVFVSAKEYGIKTLCSLMTGIPQDEITKDDVDDALCEIVNMTAGNAKLRLNGGDYMFALSSPCVINGENMSIVTKKKVHVVSKVLGNGEISLNLKVVY